MTQDTLASLPPRHLRALRWFDQMHDEVVSWPAPLEDGTLLATRAKGIYKPSWSQAALSIRRMIDGPYPDSPVERIEGRWFLEYQPEHGSETFTNRGLRYASKNGIPIGVLEQVTAAPVRYRVCGLGLVLDDGGNVFTITGPATLPGPAATDVSPPIEALLAALASTDRPTAGASRVEQRLLRASLLGSQTSADCAICGTRLPESLLVTAHIKPRHQCSEAERRDLGVVMLACRLGCDALFEQGYIWVDDSGAVRSGTRLADLGLDTLKEGLKGRRCHGTRLSSAGYFDWHRRHVARMG